jgi:hypothetical protein
MAPVTIIPKKRAVMIPVMLYRMIIATAVVWEDPIGFVADDDDDDDGDVTLKTGNPVGCALLMLEDMSGTIVENLLPLLLDWSWLQSCCTGSGLTSVNTL